LNLTNMSKQQLYEIAMCENVRLIDRYSAARELQRRKNNNEVCRDRPKYENRASCSK
jgi:hypothetical protein